MAAASVVPSVKPLVASELNPQLNITFVEDEAGLEKLRGYFARKSVFAFDTETNVVDHFYFRRIRTIQLGDRDEQYIIDLLTWAKNYNTNLMDAMGRYEPHSCFKPIIDTLRPALESRSHLKVGHNIQFDYEVLKWCLGLRMWNFYDTMLAEKVLHAGEWEFKARGIWALDDCVARHCGLQISKEKQKSFDLYSPLDDEQIEYCALDCRLPLAVKNSQRGLIEKANLFYACQIEFDAIPAFGDMYLNGIQIDESQWRPLVEKVEEKHKKIVAKLDEFFSPVVGKKGVPDHDLEALETTWRLTTEKVARAEARKAFYAARKEVREATAELETYEGEAAINYASNSQMLAALRKMGFTKTRLKDTNDRTLKVAAEHPRWDVEKVFTKEDPTLEKVGVIDTLRLYRETGKFLSTYGHSWYLPYDRDGHVCPHTGRIHAKINQLGADTGRTSSTNPNIQNLPKGPEWRGCFIASPGYKIITLDYNGCELRILTEYSREKAWLDAFKNNWDVHSVGAEIIFGDEWKQTAEPGCKYYAEHQKCKCKLHKELRDKIKSINFGIAYGMEAKKLSEEINSTVEYAQELLDKYKKAFPTLVKYLDQCGKAAAARLESRTLSQRRRIYRKPTWEVAAKLACEDWKKRGKEGVPGVQNINQKFKMLYAAIERQGKNTPIQGSNADMAKIAMGCGTGKDGLAFLWHHLETDFKARLINFVHDELVIECPEETAEACKAFTLSCMERGGAELVKSIPMIAEGGIADRWKKD